MKRYLFVLALLVCSPSLFGQTGNTVTQSNVFTMVQEMPKFNGNISEYLQQHVEYPEKERLANISGKVYVTFVVEEDGSVSGVRVLRGVKDGDGLDSVAVRVVRGMPKWIPGRQNGKPVRVQYNLPINFQLVDDKSYDTTRVYNMAQVQQLPKYPGGDAAVYISSHTTKTTGFMGDVYVAFIVERDGSLSNVTIVSGGNAVVNPDILSCVQNMGKWQPGGVNGHMVKVKCYLKISYSATNK